MLDRAHRLTRAQDFTTAFRRGVRTGSPTLVVHLDASPGQSEPGQSEPDQEAPPRMGLVVGKTVGNAVTRNQVKRRLRHLVRDRLPSLPHGALLVVRAQPAAAGATSAVLAQDLDRALERSLRRLADRGGHR